MTNEKSMIDGNEAAAYTAYHLNEVITIYPITPSSPMGELSDEWAAAGKKNIWGTIPHVTEMQSEGGASGAVHGSLQRGALTTTFTASQGLLLMIPNMFKIAGELTATVFHVSARTVATHALSIFCDHSDVMATRSTGFALLASNSVQEAMDFACIAQSASLKSRVPFLHFFDGFRTSHEIAKIDMLSPDEMKMVIDTALIREHRERALSPDRPFIRGTAQNPDVFFQAREAVNPYYDSCAEIVSETMKLFAKTTGRNYEVFEYYGAKNAERVIIIMGSGAETVQETVDYLNARNEKVGLLKVRLYRPFSVDYFIDALPATIKTIAVLDRTKEPGSITEPLHGDVVNALSESANQESSHFQKSPRVIGGRYGLSSKEFTPAMVKGVFDEMKKERPKKHFSVGIKDDVTNINLDYPSDFSSEPENRTRSVFYGLGSDGTVSANKNAIKIIGEETENYAQGYFVYDSRKAGSLTVSHLRFGPDVIHSPYLVNKANFVACHQFSFIDRLDVLETAEEGAIFLLNCPYSKDEIWEHIPRSVQQTIIDKKLRLRIIDAYKIAQDLGLGPRINTIMQTCFFLLTDIIPQQQAIESIKNLIQKTYGRRGESVVKQNFQAVDAAVGNLYEVEAPEQLSGDLEMRPAVSPEAPEFVQEVTARMLEGKGDDLPVSAFSPDGTFPSGTTKWEKRNIALEIPVWDPDVCIQCGKCAMVCPHAVIRAKIYDPALLSDAPSTFKTTKARFAEFKEMNFTIQVSPEDCTGCRLCVEVCPAKNKKEPKRKAINMEPQPPIREQENKNWIFFLDIPAVNRGGLNLNKVKNIQLLEPLFEFSGACAGCGETQYVKLLSQLFGDRALVANATGCSSIYGGNLPATPWTTNKEGRGPAWSNSLFEDNAEFGLGMRLALDKQIEYANELLSHLKTDLDDDLVNEIQNGNHVTEAGVEEQRKIIEILRDRLKHIDKFEARELESLADVLAKKSVWIVGGDGWAYDIGYGGLDHVLALGRNVNILVLDSEVYSNTGGQMSKATPLGAVAKFAAGGKSTPKKDLAMMAMIYGNVYVARVAIGANDAQTVKAFREAEAFNGASLIIAYSHCIGHGYDLAYGMEQQRLAVKSGYWVLMRYNPDLEKEHKNPLQLDSKEPGIPLEDFIYNETRYRMLTRHKPDIAKELLAAAQAEVKKRWKLYKHWAQMPGNENYKEINNG